MSISRTILGAGIAAAAALTMSSAFAGDTDLTAKLQERVAKMTPEQQKSLMALLDQMAPAKSAPEPAVAMKQYLDEFDQAKASKKFNLDLFFAHVSKDFQHPVVGGKDGARQWLDMMFKSGIVSNGVPDLKFNVERTKFTVKDGKLEAYPVEVETPIGGATLTLYAKVEDGEWRLTGIDGL